MAGAEGEFGHHTFGCHPCDCGAKIGRLDEPNVAIWPSNDSPWSAFRCRDRKFGQCPGRRHPTNPLSPAHREPQLAPPPVCTAFAPTSHHTTRPPAYLT